MRCITFSKAVLPCPRYCFAACLLVGLLTGPLVLTASGQGTVFTYQGRLTDGSGVANGNYDFRFRLASDLLGNNFVAGPVLTNGVPVSSGLFTVTLDFGSVFTGSNYWLQIDVRTNGAGSYSTLSPLQALTPAPYAIFATGASNVLGTVPAARLTGTISSAQLAGIYSNALTLNNAGNQFGGAFNGNGGGLSNVNAGTFAGLGTSNFWKTGGNSGVNSNQFIGTVDTNALEFRANSFRALRLEPNTNGAPNVIGGSTVNWVAPGVSGAVIGGGGATNYYSAAPYRSFVGADFGVIAGGLQNIIDISAAEAASIGGGEFNYITNSPDSSIGNGFENFLQNSTQAVIGGGFRNVMENNTCAVIGGGDQNAIGSFVGPFGVVPPNLGNTICGGVENSIEGAIGSSTISGGFGNLIYNANGGMIPGGAYNIVQGDYSFAAGSNAVALGAGSFVWADAIGQPFVSSADNQFLIRASGGVGIGKTNPASALDVNGTVTATSFSGSGSGLTGVAPASGSINYIQNQTAANQSAGFRITGNGIFNGGNVGIGTLSPSTALHLRDTGDTEISIQSNDTGGHRWTLQSSAVTGNLSLDASFQIIDRTANDSRLFIGTNGFVGIANRTPTNVLDVTGSISCSGSVFAHGMLLTSDRNAKENFSTLDSEVVLSKVASLPVTEWNYKGDAADIKHVGPMAQDFRAAFGLNGNDDAHISVVDESGVALAAIQALNQKLTQELQRCDAENAALKQRLERLERLLEGQSPSR